MDDFAKVYSDYRLVPLPMTFNDC